MESPVSVHHQLAMLFFSCSSVMLISASYEPHNLAHTLTPLLPVPAGNMWWSEKLHWIYILLDLGIFWVKQRPVLAWWEFTYKCNLILSMHHLSIKQNGNHISNNDLKTIFLNNYNLNVKWTFQNVVVCVLRYDTSAWFWTVALTAV